MPYPLFHAGAWCFTSFFDCSSRNDKAVGDIISKQVSFAGHNSDSALGLQFLQSVILIELSTPDAVGESINEIVESVFESGVGNLFLVDEERKVGNVSSRAGKSFFVASKERIIFPKPIAESAKYEAVVLPTRVGA